MRNLLIGMMEWRLRVRPHIKSRFAKLAQGQRPNVLFIGCSDSRVAVNAFASTRPGDTFVIRNVGNLVPPAIQQSNPSTEVDKGPIGSALEFGINSLDVKHIILCGHSGCGAVKAIANLHELKPMEEPKHDSSCREISCSHTNHQMLNTTINEPQLPGMPAMNKWLRWGHATAHAWESGIRVDGNQHLSLADQLSQLNVRQQLQHLMSYDIVQTKIAEKKLSVHGWWFDIGAAAVYSYNHSNNRFRLIDLQEANRIMASVGESPINQDLMNALRGDIDEIEAMLEVA
eukprot:TRINITY_DN10609_c0_g1_i1.p1 TRINITY_DN10609_c0_g1~~TRINITY_DN10609_c0_g1_i1.p1  ORF type:complete len:287 (+),score=62.94 TRINITY_DN10609_c0_g1_i1:53-913(+)